jgi:predicted transcriptional regulator
MKTLTRAEEQIMQEVWKLGNTTVRGVIAQLPDPKPAYNTVSTIIRILEKKEFIGHRPSGKTFIYYPLISKKIYRNRFLSRFFNDYFDAPSTALASFFSQNNNLSLEELEELRKMLNEEIENKRMEID